VIYPSLSQKYDSGEQLALTTAEKSCPSFFISIALQILFAKGGSLTIFYQPDYLKAGHDGAYQS
jgi:hypothetical protein